MKSKSTGKTNQNPLCSFYDNYDEPIYIEEMRQTLEQAGINKRYRSITFESIEQQGVPTEIAEQYKQVKRYASDIEQHVERGAGLFLKGGVGTMKTTLAVAVMRKAMEQGIKTKFVSVVSLVNTILSFDKPEEKRKYERSLNSVPILVLDDLGAELERDWVCGLLDGIINERYTRMLPTIVTTNLGVEALKKRYTGRTIERLAESSYPVTFKCKSFRKGLSFN